MQRQPRLICLAEGEARTVRFLSDSVRLAEGARKTWVTVTRTGRFTDPRYGEFEITREMLLSMVRNFEADVYGQEIFFDVSHRPENGAAAKVLQLSVEGDRLRAQLEWTDYGIEAVRKRGMRYLSAEYHENFVDNEHSKAHGPTLLGGGLTVRPVIKRLDPITLSQSSTQHPDEQPLLLHPELVRQLSEQLETTLMNRLEKLQEQWKKHGLSDAVIKQLSTLYQAGAKSLGEDKSALDTLDASYVDTGKQLAEAIGDKTVTLSIAAPAAPAGGQQSADTGAKTLSEADVKRLMQQQLDEQAKQQQQRVISLGAKQQAFRDQLTAAKLDEDVVKTLSEGLDDLITADMTDDQVKALAENQIRIGNQMAAQRQLSNLGYSPTGQPGITVDETNNVKKLSQDIRAGLRRTGVAGQMRLSEDDKLPHFAHMVLAEFDREHAHQLHREHKLLSGGTVDTADVYVPAAFQREVIRELLSDTNVLELVMVMTDAAAKLTTEIPYEQRDTSDISNDGQVFEGQGIHYSRIGTEFDIAYLTPMKVAVILTNEVMHFSRSSGINFDAWARNIQSAVRYMRELIARRVANTLQRSADSYGAATVAAENIAAQLDGSTSVIKTAEFPILRPHQVRDIKGNAIGNVQHPIVPNLDGTEVTAWDGTGDQAPGTYYRVTNYNLGYIQFVDEAGDPVTPNEATATLAYSHATNVVKVDIDVPSGSTYERHMNKVLQAVGDRKAMLGQDRFVNADFLLASPILHNMITDAESFKADSRRDGTSTTGAGDLEQIKAIPAWGTNAPGIDLGDERILLGQRGLLGYSIAKPLSFGQPFEAVDANGRPIGKKQAYAEEYSAIHMPEPVRNRMTSVIAYSADNR